MGPDLYAVLDVAPDADAAQITRAFRQLIRTLHPDATGTTPSDQDATERLRQVLEAWRILHDPAARAAYDRTRAAPTTRELRPTPRSGDRSVPTSPGDRADLIVGPTVTHDRPVRRAPHLRVGPTIRLDD